ncbi:MAG: putative iron-regulated protein [Janthinobacterium sp.]|jgi:uncharacterized iron-regulated protein
MPSLLRPLLFACATVIAVAGATHAVAATLPGGPACLSPATWHIAEGERLRATGARSILLAMAERDVVLLGEWHNEDDHHRWQLQTLAALATLRPDIVIGFEMFPRRLQPVLERWVAGELTTDQFILQSEWATVWSMPFELYLPLFQFARINRIPMLALNVDSKLTRAVARGGWDSVPHLEREGVGRAAAPSSAYRAFLFDIYSEHAQHTSNEGSARERASAFTHFVESQTTWDRAMAEALAGRLLATKPAGGNQPLMVGIIGSGHLNHGYGVPHQLRDLGVGNVGVLLPMDADANCKELTPGLADAIFALPTQASAPPPPPRMGARLDQKDDGVYISAITEGGLAQRTGLQGGDRLITLGGAPAQQIGAVMAALNAQPAGSWLPLQVARATLTLDLVLKFAPKP